mgnify:CR=1 FL=1
MSILVNAEGGLPSLGYVCSVMAAIVFMAASFLLLKKKSSSMKMTTKQIVYCSVAIALAYVCSYIKLFSMPWGGTVTLCSMLFIVLIANWYGTSIGILAGLAYGILQFLQEPYVLNLVQVCCDYILAFAALGIAGVFRNKKHGLIKGYIVGIIARGAFHSIGGYLFWMSYMPENFPKSLTFIYPIAYNYSYILAEGVLTIIILSIPAVTKALNQIKNM